MICLYDISDQPQQMQPGPVPRDQEKKKCPDSLARTHFLSIKGGILGVCLCRFLQAERILPCEKEDVLTKQKKKWTNLVEADNQ